MCNNQVPFSDFLVCVAIARWTRGCVRSKFAPLLFCWLAAFAILEDGAAISVVAAPPKSPSAGKQIDQEQLNGTSDQSAQPDASAKEAYHRTKIKELTERLTKNPNDIEALLERGRRYYETTDIKKGNSDFDLALTLAPEQPRVWHVFGQGLLYRQLNKEALSAFQKAIDLGSKEPRLFVEKGVALESLGELQQAIASYSQAIELDPKYADAYICRAQALGDVGEWNRELADWNEALELGRAEYWVYHNRGKAQHALGEYEQAIESYTLALKGNPNDAKSYYARAQLRDYLGKWKSANSDYNRAVELQPQNILYLSTRGTACIEHKEYEKGIRDLLKAIRLNPGDVGINYKPTTSKQLSAEALKHGEEQVRKLLADRPAMAKNVKEGGAIWKWTAQKFAGEDLGRLIDWSSHPPYSALAEFHGSNEQGHGEIRVSKEREDGTSRTFTELWRSIVFELHNVAASSEHDAIKDRAGKGELARDEYILALVYSEERAAQRTRAFYLKYFLPWMLTHNIEDTSPREWYCNDFPPQFRNVEEEKAYWQSDNRWHYYGAWYDLLLAKHEYNNGNEVEAMKLIELTLANQVTRDQKQYAHYQLGCIHFYASEFEEAVEEFTRALSEAPDDRDCLSMRGQAWSSLQNADNSLADHNKVITLNPDWALGYYYRATEYMRQRNFEAALSDFNKAVELEPQDPDYYHYRAIVWIQLGDLNRAIEDYSRAIKLAPEDAIVLRARASAHLAKGDVENALHDYDEVIRLEPESGYAYLNRGVAHLSKNDYERAGRDFSSGIKLEPTNPLGYYLRGKLLLESEDPKFRRPKEALQDAQKSCELSGWQSQLELSLLAAAYAANKDFENAVRYQTKALYASDDAERESQLKLLDSYRASHQAAQNRQAK